MKYLLTLLLLVPAATSNAEVEYLNLELKKLPFQVDYFFPDQTEWEYEISLNMKLVMGRAWMESDITGQAYDSAFKAIWWDYTAGFKIIEEIDLVWDHKSHHHLDQYVDPFQVRDSYGIRINFKK